MGIKKTFTLVEFIVTIAIVAILISLLQPSLNNIVYSSRVLGCTQNLSKVAVSMNLYLEDHYFYPYATFKTNPKFLFGSWDDLLGQGYDGRNLSDQQMNHPNVKVDNPMYNCPQQLDEDDHQNYLRSYAMNCNQSSRNMGGFSSLWGFGDNPESISADEVPAPSRTILLLEIKGVLGSGYQNAGVYGSSSQSNSNKDNPDIYHRSQFNYLFADNHVELLLPDETRDPSQGTWFYGKYWTRNPND